MKSRPRGFKRTRTVLLFCSLLVAPCVLTAGLQSKTNYVPPDGFVPDSTAIGVGEAVLIPVYGEDRIRSEERFSADLNGDVWFDHGTLPKPHNEGGVAEVSISKSKGCILHMIHGK
jgi:hypothetical protein